MNLPEAAAFLAQQYPVFVCGDNKRPLTENGFHDAVTDPDEARRMFRRPGAAMIAVPTGTISGLAVVDLDVKEGRFGLEWLAANEWRIPPTRRHSTVSGGLHLVFRYPEGRSIGSGVGGKGRFRALPAGVDVRGNGGYVIAPPSPGYAVQDATMPAEMPAWLIDLLDPPEPVRQPVQRQSPRPRTAGDGTPYGLAALSRECAEITSAGEGQKHYALNKAAYSIGGLVTAGELAEGVAYAALSDALDAIRHRCDDEKHAENTLRLSFQQGMAAPRPAPPPRPVQHTVRVEIVMPPEPPPYEAPPEWVDAEPDIEAEAPARPARAAPKVGVAGFPTLGIADILALPPPEWLIKGVLTVESNALIFGPYASLKSFLALDMSLCIAYGQPWQGRDTKQGAILYVAGEGVRGLGRRIRAWQVHHGLEDVDAPFRLLAAGVSITDPEVVARLIQTGKEAIEAEGMTLAAVFIDTLARAMVGADENSAQDMGRAIKGTDELRVELGCTIVTIHHSGKDKERGTRGSSALPGAQDTMLVVERNEDRLTVTIEKQKDDEEGEPITLKAHKVALDGGLPVEGAPTSLVLVADDPDMSGNVRLSGRLSGDQHQALKILQDALAEAGQPDFPGVPNGLPSIPADWWRERFYDRAKPGADQAAKQKAFRRAADALIGARMVAMDRGRVWAI